MKTSQQQQHPKTEPPGPFEEWRHIRGANVDVARMMAREGYGWEDICVGTDLGEADARRLVWEVSR